MTKIEEITISRELYLEIERLVEAADIGEAVGTLAALLCQFAATQSQTDNFGPKSVEWLKGYLGRLTSNALNAMLANDLLKIEAAEAAE
jgi:hypothetical protein